MFFGIFYTTIQPLPLLLSPPKEPFSSCHFFPFLWASKTVACLLHVCGRGQESESHGKLFTVTKNSGAMCVCKSFRVFDDSAKLIALFKQVHRYIFCSSKKDSFVYSFFRLLWWLPTCNSSLVKSEGHLAGVGSLFLPCGAGIKLRWLPAILCSFLYLFVLICLFVLRHGISIGSPDWPQNQLPDQKTRRLKGTLSVSDKMGVWAL